MFYKIFIHILRSWQQRNHLVALFIHTPGKHTETSVIVDSSGSAYQITICADGFYFRPQLTITEYVPETKRVLNQRAFSASLPTLSSKLDESIKIIQQWIVKNGARRLDPEKEKQFVQQMFKNAQMS